MSVTIGISNERTITDDIKLIDSMIKENEQALTDGDTEAIIEDAKRRGILE